MRKNPTKSSVQWQPLITRTVFRVLKHPVTILTLTALLSQILVPLTIERLNEGSVTQAKYKEFIETTTKYTVSAERVLDTYEDQTADLPQIDKSYKAYQAESQLFREYVTNLRMTSLLLKNPLFNPDQLATLLADRIEIEKTLTNMRDLTDRTQSLYNKQLWDWATTVRRVIDTQVPQVMKASLR